MIMTQEQLILKAQDEFEQIKAFVHQACTEGRRIDEVESDLWGRMLDVGRLLLQGYVAGYHQGDIGPTLEHEGRVLRRLDQPHTRRYVSVFGPFDIHRYVEARGDCLGRDLGFAGKRVLVCLAGLGPGLLCGQFV